MFNNYEELEAYAKVGHFVVEDFEGVTINTSKKKWYDDMQKFIDQYMNAGILSDGLVEDAYMSQDVERLFYHGNLEWNTEDDKITADFTMYDSDENESHIIYTLQPDTDYKYGKVTLVEDIWKTSVTGVASDMARTSNYCAPDFCTLIITYEVGEDELGLPIPNEIDFGGKRTIES